MNSSADPLDPLGLLDFEILRSLNLDPLKLFGARPARLEDYQDFGPLQAPHRPVTQSGRKRNAPASARMLPSSHDDNFLYECFLSQPLRENDHADFARFRSEGHPVVCFCAPSGYGKTRRLFQIGSYLNTGAAATGTSTPDCYMLYISFDRDHGANPVMEFAYNELSEASQLSDRGFLGESTIANRFFLPLLQVHLAYLEHLRRHNPSLTPRQFLLAQLHSNRRVMARWGLELFSQCANKDYMVHWREINERVDRLGEEGVAVMLALDEVNALFPTVDAQEERPRDVEWTARHDGLFRPIARLVHSLRELFYTTFLSGTTLGILRVHRVCAGMDEHFSEGRLGSIPVICESPRSSSSIFSSERTRKLEVRFKAATRPSLESFLRSLFPSDENAALISALLDLLEEEKLLPGTWRFALQMVSQAMLPPPDRRCRDLRRRAKQFYESQYKYIAGHVAALPGSEVDFATILILCRMVVLQDKTAKWVRFWLQKNVDLLKPSIGRLRRVTDVAYEWVLEDCAALQVIRSIRTPAERDGTTLAGDSTTVDLGFDLNVQLLADCRLKVLVRCLNRLGTETGDIVEDAFGLMLGLSACLSVPRMLLPPKPRTTMRRQSTDGHTAVRAPVAKQTVPNPCFCGVVEGEGVNSPAVARVGDILEAASLLDSVGGVPTTADVDDEDWRELSTLKAFLWHWGIPDKTWLKVAEGRPTYVRGLADLVANPNVLHRFPHGGRLDLAAYVGKGTFVVFQVKSSHVLSGDPPSARGVDSGSCQKNVLQSSFSHVYRVPGDGNEKQKLERYKHLRCLLGYLSDGVTDKGGPFPMKILRVHVELPGRQPLKKAPSNRYYLLSGNSASSSAMSPLSHYNALRGEFDDLVAELAEIPSSRLPDLLSSANLPADEFDGRPRDVSESPKFLKGTVEVLCWLDATSMPILFEGTHAEHVFGFFDRAQGISNDALLELKRCLNLPVLWLPRAPHSVFLSGDGLGQLECPGCILCACSPRIRDCAPAWVSGAPAVYPIHSDCSRVNGALLTKLLCGDDQIAVASDGVVSRSEVEVLIDYFLLFCELEMHDHAYVICCRMRDAITAGSNSMIQSLQKSGGLSVSEAQPVARFPELASFRDHVRTRCTAEAARCKKTTPMALENAVRDNLSGAARKLDLEDDELRMTFADVFTKQLRRWFRPKLSGMSDCNWTLSVTDGGTDLRAHYSALVFSKEINPDSPQTLNLTHAEGDLFLRLLYAGASRDVELRTALGLLGKLTPDGIVRPIVCGILTTIVQAISTPRLRSLQLIECAAFIAALDAEMSAHVLQVFTDAGVLSPEMLLQHGVSSYRAHLAERDGDAVDGDFVDDD